MQRRPEAEVKFAWTAHTTRQQSGSVRNVCMHMTSPNIVRRVRLHVFVVRVQSDWLTLLSYILVHTLPFKSTVRNVAK